MISKCDAEANMLFKLRMLAYAHVRMLRMKLLNFNKFKDILLLSRL